MSDSISTTRISELPENITIQMPNQNGGYSQGAQDPLSQTTYVPINVHPTPFGISPQGGPGLPISQPRGNEMGGNQMGGQQMGQMGGQQMGQMGGQQMGGQQMGQMGGQQMGQMGGQQMGGHQMGYDLPQQQQRLPSRDIPMNTLDFQQDENIQPNYIPKAKLTSDYIREYEAASEGALKQHEQKKYRAKMSEDLFSELQTPILVAILYFMFQMPIVNTLLYKYFSFLSIYNTDGNINFTGLVLKSILVGSVFYVLQYAANTISEI